MFNLGTFAQLISAVNSVLKTVNSWVGKAEGDRQKLLLELESNIELIFSYGRYDLPVDDIIARLKTASIKAALEGSSFNLNAWKKGKITKRVAGKEPLYQRYVGWTTQRLLSNIYVKINDLQTIVEMTPHKRIRKRVRLINILKLMLLFIKHISS